jgi:phosphoesterase RecJ-like protein
MRSKKIDVAEICSKFGGGGHTFAAGCTIKASLKESVNKLLKEIRL